MRKDEIRAFAGKWFDLFDDRGTTGEQLADPSFETECLKFGFKMDLGESMMREYPDIHVFDNWQELDGIIDEITDENFLGTAIHSKWRAVRRHGDEHLADELNREWFLIALGRLRYLATSADDQRLLFYGTPRKVRVISNNVSFGHPPKPDDEVEQHVTICRDGRTYLSSFVYGDGKNFKLDSNQAFNLKPEEAQALLDKIAEYFSGEHSDAVVTDVGDWDMEITNTEGAVFKEWGSLVPEVGIFNEFSDMVRRTLGRPNLLVLDGEAVIRPIDRITIEYHRVSTVKPPKVPEGTAVDHITWEYSEHLILDRKTDTIEHVQDVGTECQVLRRYHVAEGVSSFLDNCSPEDIFANVMGNASDATTDPAEEKTYTITVLFGDGSSRKAEGTFDKRGLPMTMADSPRPSGASCPSMVSGRCSIPRSTTRFAEGRVS